jgi:hypothetical protein
MKEFLEAVTRANNSRDGVTSSSQTPPPFLSLKGGSHFKTRKSLEKKIMIMGSDGTRNQELFCWRGPSVSVAAKACLPCR